MYLSNSLFKHKSILLFSILFFFFTNPSLNAAALTTNNSFESGNLGGLSCSGNCPQVSTAQKKSGKYSGNFTLTRKMSTPYRTEAVLGDKGKFDFGKEYWFSFNYRYEDWAKDTSAEIAPFQIHTRPSKWESRCIKVRSAASSAPFFMNTVNGQASFFTYKAKLLWRGAIQKKQWLNIVVHFKISHGNDGFIEAWKDGVKLGRVNGPNSAKSDNCGLMRSPYFKMGVYKWDWKAGRKATASTRRQLFIDDLKIATGSNGSSLVSSTSTKSSTPAKSTPAKSTPAKSTPAKSTPAKPKVVKLTAPPAISKVQASVVPNLPIEDPVASWTPRGREFDGDDDYMNVGKLNVPGNAMTVSGLFRAKNLSNCEASACRIISKATGTAEQDHYFMVSTIKVGSETRLRFRLKTNGVTSTLIATSGNVQEGKWVHVAAVYDGKAMRLYKDGVGVGSMSKTGNITSNSGSSVWIAGNPPAIRSRPWKGWIDYVDVYSSALTKAEIAELARQ